MKEMWATPRIAVEGFVPNDYVAVCYELACSTGNKNRVMPKKADNEYYTFTELWGDYGSKGKITVDGTTYEYRDEHEGACINPDKNAIRVDGNGNLTVWEDSSWGETLPSEVTFGETDTNGDGKIGVGDLFAWVTFSKGNRPWFGPSYWLHWAIAGALTEENPNRS